MRKFLWLAALVAALGVAARPGAQPAALTPFVDTHAHWENADPKGSVEAALAAMPGENAVRVVFMPPPQADEAGSFDAESVLPYVRGHAEKLAVLAGGGSLNVMLLQSAASGKPPDAELRRRFRERAEEWLAAGAAGFGELAVEHFPAATPYEHAPADHPLLLLLADIAAEHSVPIVLHMEAIAQEMEPPEELKSHPSQNRAWVGHPLGPDIPTFERLLAHNRKARIVWAHAGWDNIGDRTPELCRRLLRENPNLTMDIKIDPRKPGKNSPLSGGAGGTIRPEWWKLFQEFPERFVIGSDQHYPEPKADVQRWQAVVGLLNQLPEDVQRKIGSENAAKLYPLGKRNP